MDQDQEEQPQQNNTTTQVPALTGGLVSLVYHNELPATDPVFASQPILQFLIVKKLNSHATNSSLDRYRVIASDGEHFMQAMLATQLNYMAQNESIGKFTVARLDKFTCNNLQNHRYDS